MSQDARSSAWSRREVLQLIGAGALASALPEVGSAAPPSFPKGAVIRTILKDYAPEEFAGGATLFHEHLSFAEDFMTRWTAAAAATRAANGLPAAAGAGTASRAGGSPPAASSGPFFMKDFDLMSEELRIAKQEGVGCIVDAGHPDMGRDIGALRQLSMTSGMPIVAGAGLYTQPFYPREISAMGEEPIAQLLIKQVETDPVGVFGEIGSWDDMTAVERKVFRAIGRAHLATNLSIFTHTGIPGKAALEQFAFCTCTSGS